MKQQFFVGDKVSLADKIDKHSHVFWIDAIEKSKGVVGVVQNIVTYESGDIGYSVKFDSHYYNCDAKWLTIVERQWQDNTGKQPVDDDVEVEVKFLTCGKDKLFADKFRWDFQDACGDIVEWRIADSVSSNVEQTEGVLPSHVALGDNLVQVGEPYMKIWCDTCQGTGAIDETLGGESFSGRDTPCPDCDGKGWWERTIVASVEVVPVQQDKKHSHYFKKCGYDYVDVYRTIKMFGVTDPCLQHAVKKLLVTGGRGFKDIETDVQDVIDTLERWKEMFNEDRARGD